MDGPLRGTKISTGANVHRFYNIYLDDRVLGWTPVIAQDRHHQAGFPTGVSFALAVRVGPVDVAL